MGAILEQLGIEPNLLLMMAVGFLIVYFILKKFVFGRVSQMFEERSQTIQQQLEAAAQQRLAMEKMRDDYEQRIAQIEEEARTRIAEAVKEAQAARDEMLAQAREQAERIVARGKEEIEREKHKALVEIRDQVAELAILTASKIIERELDEHTHRELIDDVIEKAIVRRGNGQH
ncbi:MAG: F0F1 ATP synthase subunit B [Abditibacteriales bacterium]|nr:F0F1 ATP synthase subunit B [Abditibacteriales bacterium]MDW8364774.1 F0F1 ATP synthase subunit B [Abditibacteriales bacterium]